VDFFLKNEKTSGFHQTKTKNYNKWSTLPINIWIVLRMRAD